MSTKAHDLASQMVRKVTITPQTATDDLASPTTCDMLLGDGNCCLTVILGTIHADTTGTFQVEESDDDSSWSSISGATIAITGTSDNTVQSKTFQRSKRYCRATLDLSGSTKSCVLAAMIEEQKKYIGS